MLTGTPLASSQTEVTMEWEDLTAPRTDPARTLRTMTPDDIPAALALVHSIGWQHGPALWARLLAWSPDGCFLIEEEGRGVIGTVTTTPYGTALGWIGGLAVAQDRQRQGLGRRLMRAALDYLIARQTERIMLDATDAGRPLYASLGFREAGIIERWEGRASTYLGPRARRMRPDDFEAVAQLDKVLFRIRRQHILMRLLDEFPDLAWVDFQRGQAEGYLLARRDPSGVTIGPWMAWSTASAERLLRTAFEAVQGEQIRMHIPASNARARILASDHNLKRVRAFTRMAYGDAPLPPAEPMAELAITGLATG